MASCVAPPPHTHNCNHFAITKHSAASPGETPCGAMRCDVRDHRGRATGRPIICAMRISTKRIVLRNMKAECSTRVSSQFQVGTKKRKEKNYIQHDHNSMLNGRRAELSAHMTESCSPCVVMAVTPAQQFAQLIASHHLRDYVCTVLSSVCVCVATMRYTRKIRSHLHTCPPARQRQPRCSEVCHAARMKSESSRVVPAYQPPPQVSMLSLLASAQRSPLLCA